MSVVGYFGEAGGEIEEISFPFFIFSEFATFQKYVKGLTLMGIFAQNPHYSPLL